MLRRYQERTSSIPFKFSCGLGAFAKINTLDAVDILENASGDPEKLLPPANQAILCLN